MDKDKAELIQGYGGNSQGIQIPGSWKEYSDKLFGPDQATKVWEVLKRSSLIPPPSQDLVFVSPTANYPTHEIAIWLNDIKIRLGKSFFLVGDLANINPQELLAEIKPQVTKKHQFQYFRWDAENLPIKPESIDIIWDRKGWLWHCAQRGDLSRLADTFQTYGQLLHAGGFIVIDNFSGFEEYGKNSTLSEIKEYLNKVRQFKYRGIQYRPSELFPNAPQYEFSTVNMIDQLQSNLWGQLADSFTIKDVGKGILSNRVLAKK